MKKFYQQALTWWFVILIVALLNAVIRETTYKPLLSPYIGGWAHQISAITGIVAFYTAIYLFLSRTKEKYTQKDIAVIGLVWIAMTIIFESGMNYFVRHLSLQEVLRTYYFWTGDLWFFVILSLFISPFIADRVIHRK